MKHAPSRSLLYKALLALAAGLLISAGPAYAGPGAHGPNGEHLSEDAATHAAALPGDALPRFEAQSELFEVVGQLHLPHPGADGANTGELSLLIDRFDSNAPVLKASVEVASGAIKAQAKFHEEHGDYAVTDPQLLAQLRQPGTHPLVITIEADDETDLLDGKLLTPDQHEHDETQPTRSWLALGALAAIAAAIGLAWALKRHQAKGAAV